MHGTIATDAKTALCADLFCGAGSLSAGANDAMIELGYRPKFIAVNHWPVAINTYARNHPGARVHCVTLDSARPIEIVPEGRLDLLMAGIDCTYFSPARGGRPTSDAQRMSPWHVVHWCTELRVKRLLLENVPAIRKWGPVNERTGKPMKSREGEYYEAFLNALDNIGLPLDTRDLNCADFGDPTTRVRWFGMAVANRRTVPWPSPTHARGGDMLGAKPWRTARECIDWSISGHSIFNRPRALAPKTLLRILAGIVKFRWPKPYIEKLVRYCSKLNIEVPPRLAAEAAAATRVQSAEPFVAILRNNAYARDLDSPIPTLCCGQHIGLVEPFMLSPNSRGSPRTVEEPMPTITLGGAGNADHPGCARHAIVEPFVLSQASGGSPRGAGAPVPTIPCGGAHVIVAPYYGSGSGMTCTSAAEPLPTATTKSRFGLVIPITHSDPSNRARSIEDHPFPTITTAKRGELILVTESLNKDDCDILYRMFETHELASAMSISTPEHQYHFTGNKTEVVRQIGQAIPRRTGRALAGSLMSV
jgi:DNA (cytosine-5)-methyltransferase 1